MVNKNSFSFLTAMEKCMVMVFQNFSEDLCGVLSRFIHLIENPQYAGGGAQRGPTAGVQVKNLNYMFHVDTTHWI